MSRRRGPAVVGGLGDHPIGHRAGGWRSRSREQTVVAAPRLPRQCLWAAAPGSGQAALCTHGPVGTREKAIARPIACCINCEQPRDATMAICPEISPPATSTSHGVSISAAGRNADGCRDKLATVCNHLSMAPTERMSAIADQVRCRRRMTPNHVGSSVSGVPTDCPAVSDRWPSGPGGPRHS